MPEPGLTIAICTRNRSGLLARCLAALAAAERPGLATEVLVVANDCQDDTIAVASEFFGRLPLAIVAEHQPGLSYARNRAVAEARGRLIVWLDDDALACKAFLREYEAAMLSSPECAIFGGTILPRFDSPPPEWLLAGLPAISSAYALQQPKAPDMFSGCQSDVPFGANFAVLSSVQRQFPFDVDLGRRPKQPLSGGEEIKMVVEALAAGYRGRWVPGAMVEHLIGPERQTEDWLWRYYHAEGRRIAGNARADIWLRLKAARAVRRYRKARKRFSPQQWMPLMVRAAILVGRTELNSQG